MMRLDTQLFEDIPRSVPRFPDLTLADLPAEIGLFPLSGALLLPRGRLPLNVFEPRYVALVEDALATQRLIGVIQPVSEADDDVTDPAPPLFGTGCIGRITSFTERADSMFTITLTGLTRFRYLRESEGQRGYRQARIDVSAYAADLSELPPEPFDRDRLLRSLRKYFDLRGMEVRWDILEKIDDDALLVAVPMICPFLPSEKQALLEAETLTDRAHVLQSLLDMSGPFSEGVRPS